MKSSRPRAPAVPDLATIVSDVLGDLAFLVGDQERSLPPPGAVWMECRIAYSGPCSGTLRCWCTRDFAVQLAANLLGVEPDDPAVQGGLEDALGEFMNVVCGQLVTAWHGEDAVFNLSIPTAVVCREPPRFDPDPAEGVCALSVGGAPFYCAHEAGP